MNDFISFLFESGISMALFTLLYLALLQRETLLSTNRYFLLVALVFSLVLPFINLKVYDMPVIMLSEVEVRPGIYMLETVSVYGDQISRSFVSAISTRAYIIAVYLAGVMFFGLRLIARLIHIASLVKNNEVVDRYGVKLVTLDKGGSPFSFLSYVFVSNGITNDGGWDKMLIHELEHVKQKHTIDILILEVILVFQWCNPFFRILRHLVKANHEYIADRAVLLHDNNAVAYKKILLVQSIGPEVMMTNYFNYSLINQRIKMMTKIMGSMRPSVFSRIKVGGGFIVAAALVIVFAFTDKYELIEESKDLLLKDNVTFIRQADDAGRGGLLLAGDSVSTKHYGFAVLVLSDKGIGISTKTITNAGSSSEMSMTTDKVTGITSLTSKSFGAETATGNDTIKSKTKTINGETVYENVEILPQFPGGESALLQYLRDNVLYPVEAQEKGIQGRVLVSFIVKSDGAIAEVKVVNSVHDLLDNEAIRVVKSMPEWTPGQHKGKQVAVSFIVPIQFMLTKNKQ